MLSRARSYARTQRPGRVESALRGVAVCGLLLATWLVQSSPALARSGPLYVRLPADMPAATAQRLVSALEAQLADLTSVDLSEPDAEHALGIVSIAQSATTLSIQFADARAQTMGAPRVVTGAPGERSASEVASIVRAFVVARLEHERAEAAANAAARAAAAHTPATAGTTAQTGASAEKTSASNAAPAGTAATAPQTSASAQRTTAAQPAKAATAGAAARAAQTTTTAQAAKADAKTAQTATARAGTAATATKATTAQGARIAAAQREPARAQPAAALLATPPARGEPEAQTSPAARPDADVDAPTASRPESWRLRLAALYTGTTYAEELPWLDGLRVDASARLKRLFYLGASYGYQLPADVSNQDAQLRVAAHAVHAFFGLGRTWRSLGAALDLGLGAMRTLRSTTWAAGVLEKTPDDGYWNMLAVLRLHGRVRFPAFPRLALDIAPALELAPGARQALAQLDNEGESVVLSPGLVRARVDVGASFDVF